MPWWGRSKSKKRASDDLAESHSEVATMDAQSLAATNQPGAVSLPPVLLEHPIVEPSEADKPRSVQELRNYGEDLKEHIRKSDAVLHLMESVVKESDKASEANKKLVRQVKHLTEDVHGRDVRIESLTKQLKEYDGVHQKAAYLVARVHGLEERDKKMEMRCKEADSSYNIQLNISAELSRDKSELQEKCELLEANQAQADEKVVTLTSELEALKKVAQEKNVQEEVLQAQVLEKEKQISELQLTSDAEHRKHETQLALLREDLCARNSDIRSLSEQLKKLQEKNAQLSHTLKNTEAQNSALVSEKESLQREVENQKRLYNQLIEKEKKQFELQQAYDQRLRDLVTIAGAPVGQVEHSQDVTEQPRYSLRPHRKPHQSDASEVFLMDELCVPDGTFGIDLHHQCNPIAISKVPAPSFLPEVSTTILANYTERMAPHWYELAHALGVGNVAKSLKQTEQDPGRKCLLCLEAWIERGPEVECSWEKLLNVLCKLHQNDIAIAIDDELQKQTKYNPMHSV